MKKIIIGVVCAVLLAAVFIHKHIDDNNTGTVTLTSWYVDEDGVYHEYVEQILGEEETKRILSKEKEVSEALVSVVVSKNCALEKEDIDSLMGIVINALDSVKEENIIICDEAGNVLIA